MQNDKKQESPNQGGLSKTSMGLLQIDRSSFFFFSWPVRWSPVSKKKAVQLCQTQYYGQNIKAFRSVWPIQCSHFLMLFSWV